LHGSFDYISAYFRYIFIYLILFYYYTQFAVEEM